VREKGGAALCSLFEAVSTTLLFVLCECVMEGVLFGLRVLLFVLSFYSYCSRGLICTTTRRMRAAPRWRRGTCITGVRVLCRVRNVNCEDRRFASVVAIFTVMIMLSS
jgi:hypothetical protein